MATETILIIDDDAAIRRLLEKVMASNHLSSKTASNGEEGLALILRENFDLILLDITMEGIDGFTVLQKIREQSIATPVIIVSGTGDEYDTLYALELGADDFITKPFSPHILGAKVRAMLRRNKLLLSKTGASKHAGPFEFDKTTLKLTKNGREIFLSSKETVMLSLFLDNIGRVFSKDQLYQEIWGDWDTDDNTVMVHISHLRNKIEDDPKHPDHLVTIRGLGYKFIC